jgi:hypothetical protein
MAENEFDPLADAGDNTGRPELPAPTEIEIGAMLMSFASLLEAESTPGKLLTAELSGKLELFRNSFSTLRDTGEWHNYTSEYTDIIAISGRPYPNGSVRHHVILNREVSEKILGFQELQTTEYVFYPKSGGFSCRTSETFKMLDEDWEQSNLRDCVWMDVIGDALRPVRGISGLPVPEAIESTDGTVRPDLEKQIFGLMRELDNLASGIHYRPGVKDWTF